MLQASSIGQQLILFTKIIAEASIFSPLQAPRYRGSEQFQFSLNATGINETLIQS